MENVARKTKQGKLKKYISTICAFNNMCILFLEISKFLEVN